MTKERSTPCAPKLRQQLGPELADALVGRHRHLHILDGGHTADLVLLKRLVPNILRNEPATERDLRTIIALLRDPTSVEGSPMAISIGATDQICCFCGQRVDWNFDGRVFSAVTPCTFDGKTPLVTEFSVPNGRLMVGADFRDCFRAKVADIWGRPAEQMYAPQSYAEQEDMVRHLNAIGCAFGYIDAVAPTLWRDMHGTMFVAEITDALGLQLGWERVVRIDRKPGTFSLTDVILYRPPLDGPDPATSVEVLAGMYRMSSFSYMRDFDPLDNVAVYARIERIGDLPKRR